MDDVELRIENEKLKILLKAELVQIEEEDEDYKEA